MPPPPPPPPPPSSSSSSSSSRGFLSPSGLFVDVPMAAFAFRVAKEKTDGDGNGDGDGGSYSRSASRLVPHGSPPGGVERVFVLELPECAADAARRLSAGSRGRGRGRARRRAQAPAAAPAPSWRSRGLVTLHFDRAHRSRCPICGAAADLWGQVDLSAHVKRRHLGIDRGEPCDTCGFRTEVRGDLERHRDGWILDLIRRVALKKSKGRKGGGEGESFKWFQWCLLQN